MRLQHPLAIGLASLALVTVLTLVAATPLATVWRERAWDAFLTDRGAAGRADDVIVVDIDRQSLLDLAPWPWGRERLADLVEVVAGAGPRAVALDILLLGEDERSARALARQLAQLSPEADVKSLAMSLADRLPDADQRLAAALGRAPVVLGLVLDADAGLPTPPATTLLVRGRPDLSGLWQEESVAGAVPPISDAARGHGVLLLPGDADATVRRVPLLVATRQGLRPGLALDLARVAGGASSYVLQANPPSIQTGGVRLPIVTDAMLRLRPRGEGIDTKRTIRAGILLSVPSVRARLAGRIVLIGSSAPEAGGLRPSDGGRLVPSVQLQADAVEQILAAEAPRRPAQVWLAEMLAALAVAAACLWLTTSTSPVKAGLAALTVAVLALGFAALSAGSFGLLIDPLLLPLSAGLAFAGGLVTVATATRRREAQVRRRFEQHLAPAVVARIVAEPGLLKLRGVARVVTALFTDIEGFTRLTEEAGPDQLVALLDRYIEGTSRLVVEHGGMVEKVVGDAVHAIFNAPLDLADHPQRALACAEAILAFTESLRGEEGPRRLGLGRTRIGLETGRVIVGDVGGGRKLDYTAHGNAMNRAARLEAANKEFGSSICVGPEAAAAIGPERLRPIGFANLRGVGASIMAYEPWPPRMPQADRHTYLAAIEVMQSDPETARAEFLVLQARWPEDAALARLASVEASAAAPREGRAGDGSPGP